MLFIIFSTISDTIILYLNYEYENKYNNIQEINCIATIISNPKKNEYSRTYIIKIDNINNNKKFKNTYLTLNIKNEIGLDIKYGNIIEFRGEYKQPIRKRNYKGFDYSEYLKTIKVYGNVNLVGDIKKLGENNVNFISYFANKINIKLKQNIETILPENTKYLFLGILVGDVENISEDIIEEFKDSSLAHMLAVSGSHINYIIMGLGLIINRLPFNKIKGKLITILFLIFFMFITNFSASVVRACIMGIIILIADFFYRKPDTLNSISFSLLLILIDNPFNIENIGLLLSFGGTIGIVLCNKNILHILEKSFIFGKKLNDDQIIMEKNSCSNILKFKNKFLKIIKELLTVTLSAQIIIFPIMLISFGTISITFFISNILAGLLIESITIGGFIIVILSFISIEISKIFSFFLNIQLNILILIAKYCSKIPLSKVYEIKPNIIKIIIYYIIIFGFNYIYTIKINDNNKYIIIKNILNKYKKIYLKKVIYITIIICCICCILKLVSKDLKIYFIDVGQR